MPVTVNCSSCGGNVSVSSRAARVASCPFCSTTLIVNEDAVRALGEMALLAETPSCLAVGWPARCLKRDIRVLGRLQYRYDAGLWDEWWIQFVDDGSYAWISQDEANYTLEQPLPAKLKLPDYDKVSPGDVVELGKHQLVVKEKNEATMAGVQGELPLEASPSQRMRYLDLVGKDMFATVEYFDDGSTLAFSGKSLNRRGLQSGIPDQPTGEDMATAYPPPIASSPSEASKQAEQVRTASSGLKPQSVSCTSCGGSVELRDVSGSAMVMCRHCGSALDVTVPGRAKLLYQADQKKRKYPLEIGAQGKLQGVDYTVTGLLTYCQVEDGLTYEWTSFQLFNPEHGYVFLELENGHWLFFKSAKHPKDFDPRNAEFKQNCSYHGQVYRVFENSVAHVSYVEGELSWVARLNDPVHYMDAIRPPHLLSAEWTNHEIEWSLGVYMTPDEVVEAFQLPEDKRTRTIGVAPAQPFLRTKHQARRVFAGQVAFLLLLGLSLVAYFKSGTVVFTQNDISASEYLSEDGYVTEPFDIPEGAHVCKLMVSGSRLENSWVSLSVAFLDDKENVLLDTDATLERYSGVDGGESWSEGSRRKATLLRLEGPKRYQMVVFGNAGTWSRSRGDQATQNGSPVNIQLRMGLVPVRYFLVAMALAAFYPLKEWLRAAGFESSRWPTAEGDDDDD